MIFCGHQRSMLYLDQIETVFSSMKKEEEEKKIKIMLLPWQLFWMLNGE